MPPLLDKKTRTLPKGDSNEVQALAEAILEAARVAGLGVTVSFDDGAEIRHIYVNDTAAEILGYTTKELLGSATALTFAPEESERMHNLAARYRQGEITPNLVETVVMRKDGERIPAEITFSVVALAGEPAIVTFLRDIRERKLWQAQLVQSDRMATLGMLAAGVAHEINNPLAYATLNVETLVRQLQRLAPDDPAGPVGPAISAARDGLARVATIVRDLQSLSTPKSVERWPVDVKEVVESALNLTMHAIRGRAKVVRDFREVTSIKTDPTRLGQILLNLVFNAAQAFDTNDESKNFISLSIASSLDAVVITVADNGRGIANEHLARIFEPFFTTKSKGIGLGLAICQTLANSLGGILTVESEVGKGTKFALQLPALGAHAERLRR